MMLKVAVTGSQGFIVHPAISEPELRNMMCSVCLGKAGGRVAQQSTLQT